MSRRRELELLALLAKCEFTDNSGEEYPPTCPVCGGGGMHEKECALGAALKRGPGPKTP
jgi:hypothetical protein